MTPLVVLRFGRKLPRIVSRCRSFLVSSFTPGACRLRARIKGRTQRNPRFPEGDQGGCRGSPGASIGPQDLLTEILWHPDDAGTGRLVLSVLGTLEGRESMFDQPDMGPNATGNRIMRDGHVCLDITCYLERPKDESDPVWQTEPYRDLVKRIEKQKAMNTQLKIHIMFRSELKMMPW